MIAPISTRKPSPDAIGKSLLTWILRKKKPKLLLKPKATARIADLFCGCGGLTLGTTEALRSHKISYDIRLALDNDASALSVYRDNFDTLPENVICDSINNLFPGGIGSVPTDSERAATNRIGKLDILLAGPPCQGHSDLNNHSRRDDPKNQLYLRVVRFAELIRPQVVLVENVPGARHDRSQVVQNGSLHLEQLGYHVHSEILSADQLGLPQLRKRLVIIAIREKSPQNIFANFYLNQPECTLRDLLIDLEDEPERAPADLFTTPSRMTAANFRRANYLFANDLYDLPNHQRPACHRDKNHSYKSMYGRLTWDRPAQTITGGFGSMGQGRFVHPTRKRVITPHEAARIQGFPDHFIFKSVKKRTELHQMIGNAVPPIMAFKPISELISNKLLTLA